MEARYAVIGAILDRYEEHSKDWMGYRDQAGNRSLPVTQKLYDELTGIQWGRLADPHGWIMKLN